MVSQKILVRIKVVKSIPVVQVDPFFIRNTPKLDAKHRFKVRKTNNILYPLSELHHIYRVAKKDIAISARFFLCSIRIEFRPYWQTELGQVTSLIVN